MRASVDPVMLQKALQQMLGEDVKVTIDYEAALLTIWHKTRLFGIPCRVGNRGRGKR